MYFNYRIRCSSNITESTNQNVPLEEKNEDVIIFSPCPSPPPESCTKPKRKRKNADIDELFAGAIEAFKEACKQKEEKKEDKENDALQAWGKMIMLTVSEMSPVKKAKVMEKVTSLVMTCKFENNI